MMGIGKSASFYDDLFGEEKLMKSIFHNCRNLTVTRCLFENIIGCLGQCVEVMSLEISP